ncbi:MAG: dihydroorotase [Flavobacteriales bacterium]|nr:dihydroorotase [Flavobacteriales bacterium]
MKDLLLRDVTVLDPGGPLHKTCTDLLIVNGRLKEAGAKLPKGKAEEVRMEGLHASPGWVDLRAHFREPGEEYKQGITIGLDAAAAGGFTAVAVMPSTHPPVDHSTHVEALLQKAKGHAVRLLPIGALTQGLRGEQLAELHDMKKAGAVAFSDDLNAVRNNRLMLIALQYARNIDATVMAFAMDPEMAAQGQMNESVMATRLGLRGIPEIAETIHLARDLRLLEYAESRLHVATISTAGAVELIRDAKARKLRVTASVAAHHLLLDDGCLRGYDPNFKMMPPLRGAKDIEALREAVKDGTIDCVVSDHRPEDIDHKRVEFPQAAFGAIGLQTAYAAASTALKGRMSTLRIAERFCQGPRAVLGLPVPHIAVGEEMEITLFAPDRDWSFSEADIIGPAKNSPFVGQRFTGKALGVVAKGQVVWGG